MVVLAFKKPDNHFLFLLLKDYNGKTLAACNPFGPSSIVNSTC